MKSDNLLQTLDKLHLLAFFISSHAEQINVNEVIIAENNLSCGLTSVPSFERFSCTHGFY